MKTSLLLVGAAACLFLGGQARDASATEAVARAGGAAGLEEGFRDPSGAARPWAYWWWLGANVTEASLTRDLEAMKEKGLGGVLVFDVRGYHDTYVPPPPARTEFMSDRWRQLLKHAVSEAGRLGLQVSVNLSRCAGALKGPWELGDDVPKNLCWASADLEGPQRLVRPLPREDWGRSWDVAVVAARRADTSPAGAAAADAPVMEVVDLSGRVDAGGRLTWDVPAGRWTLIRFACAVMENHAQDVDILSATAVEGHFKRMAGAILADAGPLAGKTLSHFYSVSWEGAIPTWTAGLDRHFRTVCGYDMRPYLPVLAGLTVRSPEVSKRFLRDYHKTLGDCFMNHCYGTLQAQSAKAGVQWHSESGGPWTRSLPIFSQADQLAFLGRNDMPQGEFWYPTRGFNRPVAMAAHIYGRPLAAAEAFTHMTYHWSVCPAALKPCADAAFADGINHLIWHTFTASLPEFGKPGVEYFAGSHLNPNVTWWEQAGPFLRYLARCQFMLRQGQFVADVACYTGDKPYLHWGRGEKWSPKPALVLGKGYTYDLVNTEVLLGRLAVQDGRLALPDGLSYRVLAVDLEDEAVPPEALAKIAGLTRAGATVVLGRRPRRAPGLKDYPACDQEVARLAGELWGAGQGETGRRPLGKGYVVSGLPIDEVLKAEGVAPDFEGPWDYIHRRADGVDLYFVAGRKAGEAACTFRVGGKEPEFWDPATGRLRDAVHYSTAPDGRTLVPIALPENGSIFVVFRKPALAGRIASVAAPAGAVDLEGRVPGGVEVTLWGRGRAVLETADAGSVAVEAADLPEAVTLAGPWDVRFAPGIGAPASAVFESLTPWNEHADPAIRYFSGTATYRKTIRLDDRQAGGLVRLDLGEIAHVAEVRVNGRSLGVVWTAPWSVDLTRAVKPGENVLEIDVTNVWANRLIGDAGLPERERVTRTNVPLKAGARDFKPHQGYSSQDPLVRSGLLGPVRLEFGRRQTVRF